MAPVVIWEDFLPVEEHAAMLALALGASEKFLPAMIGEAGGGTVKADIRKARAMALTGLMANLYDQRVRQRVGELIIGLGVDDFVPGLIDLGLVAHNDEDFLAFHDDVFRGDDPRSESPRRISTVYYFHREPKRFEGGALRLYRFGAKPGSEDFIDIEPKQNRLVAFPSWAAHEVRPVRCRSGDFADSRFSVNGWIHGASADAAI